MDEIAALFGIGCVVAGCISLLADADEWHDAVVASALLTASWALSNVAWVMNALQAFPLLDVALAVYFFFAALNHYLATGSYADWRASIFLCLLAQLCLHVAYAILGEGYYTAYALLLNALFGLQLISVASTGVPNGLASLSRICRRFRYPPVSGTEP